MATITIPAGTRVNFDPSRPEETVTTESRTYKDATWGVNGSPGWVFARRDGEPTAYTTDWQRVIEETGASDEIE